MNPLDETYDKIGGWLVLPAIIHPLYGIFQNIVGAADTFGQFSEKLQFNSQVYIVVLGLASVAFALAWVATIYYACKIDPLFPKLYIWTLILTVVCGIAGIMVADIAFGAKVTHEDFRDVAKTIAVGCIWVPYLLVSKRVKATFYGIPFPQKPPRSAFAPLDLKGETRASVDPETLRYRRKGNRLGIFVTLASLAMLCVGILGSSGYQQPAWAGIFFGLGAIGTLFGYLFSRLWYWFRAA